MEFLSSHKTESILKNMSTSELNKEQLEQAILEVRIKGNNPSALELKAIRDVRDRIRKEEVARTLFAYNKYAKEYLVDANIKSKHINSPIWDQIKYVVNKDKSTIAQIGVGLILITMVLVPFFGLVFESWWPFLALPLPALVIFGKASTIKFFDTLKIRSKLGQLVLVGPRYMIDEVMPSEIDAAMQEWILEKEYEELEKANPEDILEL